MTDGLTLSQNGSHSGFRTGLVIASGLCLGLALPAFLVGRAALGGLLLLALVGAFGLCGKAILIGWKRFALSTEGKVLGGVAAVFLVTVLLSTDIGRSFETWLRTVILLPIGVALLCALRAEPMMHRVALRALIGGSLLTLLVASYTLYIDETPLIAVANSMGRRIAPNIFFLPFAAILACVSPIVLWAVFQCGKLWGAMALMVLPLSLLVIWGNGVEPNVAAIGGLIGGGICLPLVWGMLKLTRPAIFAVMIAMAGGTIVLAGVFLESLPTPESVTARVTAESGAALPFLDWHRQVIWGFTYDVFKDHWLTGVGLNTVPEVPGGKTIIPNLSQEFIPGHPHNWVLEIASEAGVFGLLGAIIALLCAILMAVRIVPNGSASWAILFLLAVYWISGLANFSVWSAWWNAVLVVGLALLWAAIPAKGEKCSTKPAKC